MSLSVWMALLFSAQIFKISDSDSTIDKIFGTYQVKVFGNSVQKILSGAFGVEVELGEAAVQQSHLHDHGEAERT